MWIKSENLLVFDLQVIHGESNKMWPRTLIAQLVKKLSAVQDTGWIPGSERSTGEGIGYLLREKGKATHSSILAWRIPWTV